MYIILISDSIYFMEKVTEITKEKSIDTGMAMKLLFLIFGNFFIKVEILNIFATVSLLIAMTFPKLYKPLGVVWFGLSYLLGSIVSRIVLGIIFYGFVTPFGRFVLLFKNDPMNRKGFKKSDQSVFVDRNYTFTKKDIVNAF